MDNLYMAKMDKKKIDLICVDTEYDGFLTLHKWYKGELSHSYLPSLKIDNYFCTLSTQYINLFWLPSYNSFLTTLLPSRSVSWRYTKNSRL